MKAVREAVWLLMLVVGSVALPSQTQSQSHFRGVVKAKQTTPMYLGEQKSTSSNITTTIASTDIGSNDSDNSTDTSSAASKSISVGLPTTMINYPLTVPLSSSSSSSSLSPSPSSPSVSPSPSPLPVISLGSTGRNSLTEMIETLPTTSPSSSTIAGAELGGASTTESGMSSRGRTTINSSAAPTETSSRTIATSVNEDTNTYALSSKKSTSSFNEIMTTPGSVSAKETRESTGKIRPQIKLTTNYTSLGEAGVRLPEGASAALAKPTKYHYYPHNQHIYLLPECAVQQVCNAVYVRLNFTQPLCACPGRYRDPCSASLDSDDLHTTELVTDPRTKALTLVKTCEPVAEMRECRTPRDWSLLALQNIRTGKSHYLVICRCPDANILEGPMSHDQPTYASVPGIRVYGMMCVQGGNRRGRPLRYTRSISDRSEEQTTAGDSMYTEKEETDERSNFPWYKVKQLINTAVWD